MEELCKVYGESYVRYVLALNEGEEPVSDRQQQVMSLLQSLVSPSEGDESASLRTFDLADRLNRYIPDYGTTMSSALRMFSGGELRPVEHSNGLTHELLILARDTWPVFLLPPPEEDWLHNLSLMRTYSHPSNREFLRLALDDDAIRRLFPAMPAQYSDRDELLEVTSEIVMSSGQGI